MRVRVCFLLIVSPFLWKGSSCRRRCCYYCCCQCWCCCCCHAIIGLFIGFFSVCVYLSFLFFSFNKKNKNQRKKSVCSDCLVYIDIFILYIYTRVTGANQCSFLLSQLHTHTHSDRERRMYNARVFISIYLLLLFTENFPFRFVSVLFLTTNVRTR